MSVKINKENFHKLLNWLDSDAKNAAEQYGHIHFALIKIFFSYGFQNAEELADETIDRVAEQVDKIEKTFVGEKIKYFRAVAKYIRKESFRNKKIQIEIEHIEDQLKHYDSFEDEVSPDAEINCLEKCLKKLSSKDRKMIIGYHNVDNWNKKKEVHKKLAEKYSLTDNALRVQAFRLKNKLSDCIEKCMKKDNSM